jgi:hypothetical protein
VACCTWQFSTMRVSTHPPPMQLSHAPIPILDGSHLCMRPNPVAQICLRNTAREMCDTAREMYEGPGQLQHLAGCKYRAMPASWHDMQASASDPSPLITPSPLTYPHLSPLNCSFIAREIRTPTFASGPSCQR